MSDDDDAWEESDALDVVLTLDAGPLDVSQYDVTDFKSEEPEKIGFMESSSPELLNTVSHEPDAVTVEDVGEAISNVEKLDFSKNLKNFFLLLIEKRRIFFVKKIIDSFLKLCAQKRGEVKASLISSKELSETELENISKELSSSTSSTIKFNYKVDKELIGGLKLQLGSFMIDTSIKNKLNKYKQKMLES